MKRDTYFKIKTVDELGRIIDGLKKKGKRIVHCHGVFDLLHPGHIKHFEAAKKKGDILIVTLTKDEHVNRGPGRPVFNQNLRAETIAALECVDFVAVNDWSTAVETIRKIRPHFYVKGSDYAKREDDVTAKISLEEEAIKSVGGDIYFTDEISFSSSTLINTFLNPHPDDVREFFLKLKNRFTPTDIINSVKKNQDIKILVVGDIIIDEYHYCVGMGKSQKDNIIATRFINDEIFAGGVLAAANHLAGFCKDVTLVSCIGKKNDYEGFISGHLKSNIKRKFFHCENIPTVVKRRFVDPAFLNKLFEICYLEDAGNMPSSIEKQVCSYLESNLKKFDMVLVADFGHGLITPKVVDVLCKKAKFLALNVQTNSANLGFNLITKFKKADYICIDEPEIRLACHDKTSDLKKLILDVSKKLDCQKIIITRGHKGSLVYSKKEGFTQIPIFSKEVVDRIGAGDAFFSITAPCVFKNNPMDVVGFVGNAVGALKVLIVGNRSPVEPGPLFKYITTLLR